MAKLDAAALAELTRIVKKYRSLREDILMTDEQLQALAKKSVSLKEQYESARADEEALFETLRSAYGDGGLDPQTLEWVPKN